MSSPRARWLSAALACLLAAGQARGDLVLSDHGRTLYVVQIRAGATPAEHYAAEELASFLGQATGAAFAVKSAGKGHSGPKLVVAVGAKVGEEGFTIDTRGDDVVFAGGSPRGALYAVYTFLEDVVGCRWWTRGASYIPRRTRLVVPELHIRQKPAFEYRDLFYRDAFAPTWYVRHKLNGISVPLDPKYGGGVRHRDFVHSFYRLAPPEECFADHPDWFSERDGHRFHERGQLCLSNQELRAFVTQRVLAWLRESPDSDIVSVSQNDCEGWCECPGCAKLLKRTGCRAGAVLDFVNAIAAGIEDEFPRVALSTLAYRSTRRPPPSVRPRPNVIVELCPIECSFSQPLSAPVNASFASHIAGWSRLCSRLYVWDYVTNTRDPFVPHPNLRVLAPNLRFFRQHGVKGVFVLGNDSNRGAEMAALRGWVMAKLLWDPDRDPEALIDEFLRGYYGPAAEHIRAYIDLTHDSLKAAGCPIWVKSHHTKRYLPLDVLAQAQKTFDAAEAAVRDDPELTGRVHVARIPLRYVWHIRWDELRREAAERGMPWPGPKGQITNARSLVAAAREKLRSYSRAEEHKASWRRDERWVDQFERQVLEHGRRDALPPAGFKSDWPHHIVDLQDHAFWLASRERGAALAPDPLASDRVAARIPGPRWAVANVAVNFLVLALIVAHAAVGSRTGPRVQAVRLGCLAAACGLAALVQGTAQVKAAGVPIQVAPGLIAGLTLIVALVLATGASRAWVAWLGRARERAVPGGRKRRPAALAICLAAGWGFLLAAIAAAAAYLGLLATFVWLRDAAAAIFRYTMSNAVPISALALVLCAAAALVAFVLWRRRRRARSLPGHDASPARVPVPWPGAALGAVKGVVLAGAALTVVYDLGGVADYIQARLTYRPKAQIGERAWRRSSRRALEHAKRTLDRSWAAPLLRRVSALDVDLFEPSWAVARHLFGVVHDARTRYRCYAAVRCDLTGGRGQAFSLAVYDVRRQRRLWSRSVRARDASAPGYHVYDMGSHVLSPGCYLAVGPPASARAARAVWVDRFFLVREAAGK